MSPRQVRTFTTGALASVALAVTGTAVLSAHTDPAQIQQSAAGEAPTVAPDAQAVAGQRGQSVGSGLRDKALRTAVLTDIPPSALAAYQRAASSVSAADPGCHLPWTVLAGVGQVESNHGRSTSRNAKGIVGVPLDGQGVKAVADTDAGALDGDKAHDRAVGPMQILPGTWATVAVDGDGDGKRDPQDIDDAALAAAVYLCGSGKDLSTDAGQEAALRSYNNSASYVTLVMSVARAYAQDQKATYALGSLPTGGVDLSSIGTTYGTDAGTKTKAAKTEKTATKKTAAKTSTSKNPAAKTPTTTAKTPAKKTPGKSTTTPPKKNAPTDSGPTTPAPTQSTSTLPTDLVGQSYEAAKAELIASKLVAAQGSESYAPAAVGAVLAATSAATPEEGKVPEGTTVTLDTSLGSPDVVGLTETVARERLAAFTVTVEQVDDAAPAGQVVSMTPDTSDDTTKERTLLVSTGKDPQSK